jgi:hypothetical protein
MSRYGDSLTRNAFRVFSRGWTWTAPWAVGRARRAARVEFGVARALLSPDRWLTRPPPVLPPFGFPVHRCKDLDRAMDHGWRLVDSTGDGHLGAVRERTAFALLTALACVAEDER